MAENKLAIIGKELQENTALQGETVTVHLIEVSNYNIYREHELQKFSLLDDSSIECLSSLDSQTDFFKIAFFTAVSRFYEYEISLYYAQKPSALIHVETVNMSCVPNRSKCEIPFPEMKPNYAISNSFVFFTRICRKDVSCAVLMNPSTFLPDQLTDCSLLFKNNALTNFRVVVEDREFRVHKEILAAKSPVFLAMFDSEMKESKENQLNIEDVDSNVVQEMLRYIYMNSVEDLGTHAEELLKTADKYDIPKLKSLCCEELSRSLKLDNSLHLLELADKFHESALKERALKFIQSNIKEIIHSETYKTWRQTAPANLMADIMETLANFFINYSEFSH